MVDYGWGWKVDANGSIVLDKNGKIETVDDLANFGQQLSLRLLSPRGSHPFDPSFGLDMIAIVQFKKFYKDIRELTSFAIPDCLTNHPFVKSIDFVAIDYNSDRSWTVDIKVISQDEQEMFFNTIIEENADIRSVINNVLG